jgi:hypothetical protein
MAQQSNTIMKQTIIALASFAIGSAAFAGNTYQATGPVVEVTDTKIVVQKDKEKWEIARTAQTKTNGTPKVGDKVTVYYTMTASSIEVKPGKAEATEKEAPAKK